MSWRDHETNEEAMRTAGNNEWKSVRKVDYGLMKLSLGIYHQIGFQF